MSHIQFIQTTPTELANLVIDAVRQELKEINRLIDSNTHVPVKELLTRKETAELFAVSLVTIHEWCKSDILKPYKVGNRTYFKRTEVMEVVSRSNVA
jgi:excisionase family DNA binding protein